MKKLAYFLLSAPSQILLALCYVFSFHEYSPTEIYTGQNIPLALQGGKDWGGSNIFVACVVIYFVLGFLSCLYLAMKLNDLNEKTDYKNTIIKSFKIMKFHFIWFAIFAILNIVISLPPIYIFPDAKIDALFCDFVQLAILALIVYLTSVLWISYIHKIVSKQLLKIFMAPLIIVLWVYLSSDGISIKAGQKISVSENPEYAPNSWKHELLLQAHNICRKCLVQ